MTPYEEAFEPLVNIIVARVSATIRQELQRAVPTAADRSLTKSELAKLLGLTEQTLMNKIQLGSVPAPYTARGEQPRWSEKTIEKYMSGSWGDKNEKIRV